MECTASFEELLLLKGRRTYFLFFVIVRLRVSAALSPPMVHDQLGDGQRRHNDRRRHGAGDAHDEGGVVPAAHALVQPLAVVVEAGDALVAGAAVLGADARRRYVAKMATARLDDVLVFRPGISLISIKCCKVLRVELYLILVAAANTDTDIDPVNLYL